MNTTAIKSVSGTILKKWWCSLLVLPFIFYSLHQIYWALRFNIFFAVTYDYPFPVDIIHFFVDNFLLIAHEAGHTFFSIVGIRFITILGGSLFQILLPAATLLFFWVNRKSSGIQLSLCLVGYSWLDVAGYAADAGARRLPLIGGLSKESHDWHNILLELQALEHDVIIAIVFVLFGIISYLTAILLPLFYKRYKEVTIDLKLN